MHKVKLDKAWTWHDGQVTSYDFTAGVEVELTQAQYDAAIAAGALKGKEDGDAGAAKAGAKGRSGAAEK